MKSIKTDKQLELEYEKIMEILSEIKRIAVKNRLKPSFRSFLENYNDSEIKILKDTINTTTDNETLEEYLNFIYKLYDEVKKQDKIIENKNSILSTDSIPLNEQNGNTLNGLWSMRFFKLKSVFSNGIYVDDNYLACKNKIDTNFALRYKAKNNKITTLKDLLKEINYNDTENNPI